MNKMVKVNFFQKSFDTRYRDFLFSYHQGNYFKYLKNRIQWYLYPNIKKVSTFPLHLDIETTALCNLRCPMCANRYVTDEKFRKYGNMDFDLFKKIIDECAENHIFSIRLSWRGEVFTNKRFIEYVRYAKVQRKIPQVSFLTNGVKLKEDVARELIDIGVDYISVSIDGMDELYEKIRYPSKFSDVYQNLSMLKKLKKQMGKKKPMVRITTLWPAIAKNPDVYYKKVSKISDKIVYNPLKDYSITTQDRKDFNVCQFLWERLFVGFDGSVHPCSNTKNEFIIADANENTIKEIWHSDKINELRETHQQGKRLDIFPCNKCSYGVDFEKHWRDRNWKNWEPNELLPKE